MGTICTMVFYVDADSFPSSARAVICRASEKHAIKVVFVAQRKPTLPKSKLVKFIEAGMEPDAADKIILERAKPEDLVFTRDIPFAALLVAQGVIALNDRGTLYTAENVRTRLSERDFMADLREAGITVMNGKNYGPRELQEFANAFDRELTRRLKNR